MVAIPIRRQEEVAPMIIPAEPTQHIQLEVTLKLSLVQQIQEQALTPIQILTPTLAEAKAILHHLEPMTIQTIVLVVEDRQAEDLMTVEEDLQVEEEDKSIFNNF